ncbi:MAG: hypothetical protein AB202_02380 [Parcubacteria bacterium C7867-007]|nr:MAG: hypothetical protein AB202_02380 [Parcubacteria bacterium C7867-007]
MCGRFFYANGTIRITMQARRILSLSNFFAAAHFFLIIYILTPYLAIFMPKESTGLVVALGALVTLGVFPFMPKLVAQHGAQRLVIFFALVEMCILLWLALIPTAVGAVLLAALACAVSPLLVYQLDILLEATVESEDETGRVRTAFLTAGNIMLVIAPLIIGLLLDGDVHYDRVFLVASLSLIPVILLMFLRKLPSKHILGIHNVTEACACIAKDKDLRAVAIAMGILQFFFHLAPLYIPLYLHTVLGIPWSQLGWVFAVMLIPFVVLEYPAGVLADTKFGDRILLIAGFICTGISFAFIGFITAETSILIILSILLLTRIGAALVEAMVEGHFFRRVSEQDINTVSIFRMMRPLGALIAPLVGTIILMISNFTIFFIVTGILIAVGGVIAANSIQGMRLKQVAISSGVDPA